VTSKRIVLPILVAALVATAFVIPFGSPSSSNANAVTAPAEPVTAFTIMDDGQGLCDLYAIDLATGALTDLPAAASEAACAADLAVAANGTVYGIAGTQFFTVGSVNPAYDSLGGAELITFSADGTPSGQTLTVDGFPISGISGGSIAIDASGTVYVIAINETTCDPRLSAPGSFTTGDGDAFSCLFTVNLSTGELTQVGDGFSPNRSVFGLTSCASNMWSIMPGLMPLSVDQSPASFGIPWASIDPTTGIPTEAGISTQLLGFDCVATGNTVYAMSTDGFGLTANAIRPSAPDIPELGTVDPTSGVFTETVTMSTPTGYIYWAAFAVLPIPVEPKPDPAPVAPNFTH
jgi:hypothetical protein